MFERLKRALVESYVGAIALGWTLAQTILHFVGIFSSPVAGWVTQKEIRQIDPRTTGGMSFPFRDAVPELMKTVLLLAVCYGLIRWLYYTPVKIRTSAAAPDPGPSVASSL
jgi:hypothetical protein